MRPTTLSIPALALASLLLAGTVQADEMRVWTSRQGTTVRGTLAAIEGFQVTLQTDHFLVASSGKVKPQVIAEIAERLWQGMASQHMNFRRDWGDKRRLIIICGDLDSYQALGNWHFKYLESRATGPDGQDLVRKTKASWNAAAGNSIDLPAALRERRNLHPEASVFNASARDYRKVFAPFPTNTLAGHLLRQQTGPATGSPGGGGFAIATGHAFFKEILLAGRTETHLLNVEGSLDDVATKAGFEDGTGWARILKTEVKRGRIKPDLAVVLATEVDTLAYIRGNDFK